ncbi:unnamed protein product [Arabidopsis arenosa]|uniref:3'-5' exonuclease domain-containing protein n=1 Tax=Arabidopsis arenosa TaxID=38785 RepID=A0A8S2AD91_ARAAE|nr:unnamed protein product [Arabidopsis arenosa]
MDPQHPLLQPSLVTPSCCRTRRPMNTRWFTSSTGHSPVRRWYPLSHHPVVSLQDKDKLERFCHQLDIWRLVDIRNYLPRWLWKCTFERIVEECLGHQGVKKDKEICRSNWGARSLSDDQIVQASHDVFVCCKLGVKERVWKMRA